MDECSNSLLSWGTENGASVHEGLDLFAPSKRCGRGIVARSAITGGEVLMRIPAGLTVQSRLELLPEGPLADFWRGHSKPVSNVLRLTLTVLHELHVQATSSRWWPFFDLLAKTVDVDLPLFWQKSELRCLQGTAVMLSASCDAAEEPQKMFERVVLPLMVSGGDLWPEGIRSPGHFFKCLSWVMSRGFCGGLAFALDGSCMPLLEAAAGGTEQGPFMIPLFDLVNHSSWPEERSADLSFEDGTFVVRASRDIAAGEEVFKSYGEHGDAELLRTYGFVEAGEKVNPSNKVIVTQAELLGGCRKALGLSEGADLEADRMEHLRGLDLLKPVFSKHHELHFATHPHGRPITLCYERLHRWLHDKVYAIPPSGVLPADLFTVVQVILMAPKEFEEFRSSDLRMLGKQFHTRSTLHGSKVAACLLLVLALSKQRYGQDVNPENSGTRGSLAESVRAGELAILKAGQSYVVTSLAPAQGRPVRKKRAAAASAKGEAKAAKTQSSESQRPASSGDQ